MDVSTEFDQRACFLVACDPSSMRPRNKTLTKVVHVLPDDFFGILSLVRLLPPFFCDCPRRLLGHRGTWLEEGFPSMNEGDE
jgi:hypothetical protein